MGSTTYTSLSRGLPNTFPPTADRKLDDAEPSVGLPVTREKGVQVAFGSRLHGAGCLRWVQGGRSRAPSQKSARHPCEALMSPRAQEGGHEDIFDARITLVPTHPSPRHQPLWWAGQKLTLGKQVTRPSPHLGEGPGSSGDTETGTYTAAHRNMGTASTGKQGGSGCREGRRAL